MKLLKVGWPLVLVALLVYFLGQNWGTLPAIGKLLSPFKGFLQNTEASLQEKPQKIKIEGLVDSVSIHWDGNKVPHIFAQNDHDLYLAQGYTVASDRLWQMEFYTLVAAGRLTEVVGERALAFDKYNRRRGMARAAKEISENLKSDSLSYAILRAYSKGVNAYIKQLSEAELPLEYKILGYQPAEWSPFKTILMLMNMRNTLSGRSYDTRLTQVAKKHGLEVINELFPIYPWNESPIIPVSTAWDFDLVPIPETPIEVMAKGNDIALDSALPNKGIGSNNWAIHGSKSATGLPILSNDPHLGLSLPSIWYQIQLSSPTVNVYGSCLPGTPGVTIGFNKDIAWGVTNVGSDVLDFYKVKFKDVSKTAYWHDGKWKPTKKILEIYKIKDGKTHVDTLVETHHGPVVYMSPEENNYTSMVPAGYAMQWVALETEGSDLLTFHYLNRAEGYEDYRAALKYYVSPAQNFVFASNENDIAITANGKFPIKWEGQGRFLLDGTRQDHDWQGWIPMSQNPTVKNPERQFVSSANQFTTDPSYPYYMDWRYADPYRGTRINERLSAMQNANADSLRSLQNDNYNKAAEWFLPIMLSKMSDEEHEGLNVLQKWNKHNDSHEMGATIFEQWMDTFMKLAWEDDFPEKDQLFPTESATLALMKSDDKSPWWDIKGTKPKENLSQILHRSFYATIDSLTVKYGPFSEKNWAWHKVKSTDVNHLVPAFTSFSRKNLVNGGGWRIVNATTSKTGPSWRMIVELDKEWPRAYGVYPGGQSGNVGSPYYDNMLPTWNEGDLYPLYFMKNEKDRSEKIQGTWTLNP